MSPDLEPMGRLLLVVGAVCIVGGMLLMLAPKVPWLGHLPGDFMIERQQVRFYFPLTSCLLASIVISMVLWLINKFHF